jgi:hypothetical protein
MIKIKIGETERMNMILQTGDYCDPHMPLSDFSTVRLRSINMLLRESLVTKVTIQHRLITTRVIRCPNKVLRIMRVYFDPYLRRDFFSHLLKIISPSTRSFFQNSNTALLVRLLKFECLPARRVLYRQNQENVPQCYLILSGRVEVFRNIEGREDRGKTTAQGLKIGTLCFDSQI